LDSQGVELIEMAGRGKRKSEREPVFDYYVLYVLDAGRVEVPVLIGSTDVM